MRVQFSHLLSILGITLFLAPASAAGPIDTLKPGEWYEVPNSNLRAVAPNPNPNGDVSMVMGAWSGGAYDSQRDRLIIWGGGHADYSGNELYAFDVNTLSWSRVWGPSTNIPFPSCSETYPDGNPSSRHTYGGLEYLPDQDAFWANGGSAWSCGWFKTDTWTFSFRTGTWARQQYLPIDVSLGESGNVTAFDPVTRHIFMLSPNNGGFEFDPIANTWTKRTNSTIDTYKSGALDWKRRILVVLGGGGFNTFVLQPDGSLVYQDRAISGATEIVNATHPGIVYDPVSDQMVAWSGGPNVYTLNLDTWAWTKRSPAASNTVTPTAAATQGTYGRWRYIASKNAFIGVNDVDEDVYIYKLSSGGGTTGDTTPPAAIRDLRTR